MSTVIIMFKYLYNDIFFIYILVLILFIICFFGFFLKDFVFLNIFFDIFTIIENFDVKTLSTFINCKIFSNISKLLTLYT